MEFIGLANSEGLFGFSEPLPRAEISSFHSFRGRILALTKFFELLCILPLAFLYKLYRTSLSSLGVGFGVVALTFTLCSSHGIREFFIERVSRLAKNLADWILWPFAAIYCLGRLLLAASLHPALFFRT